ncbi:MAG: hypothetical protein HZB41_03360 [Ignavibacteriae bacterium]|nr:hypothetical protein [Ignavibacteriota bacterium]
MMLQPFFTTALCFQVVGCNSARWAFRLPSPEHPGTWIHLKYAPCEENGCCITETIWCWNEVTNSEEFISENTQYFSEGDCFNKLPLYNPFEGYGPEWIISPPSPCGLSCYIDN